jgi:Na+/H+ antiporter NhaC
MMFGLILITILIIAVIWFILDKREQSRLAAGKPRHSPLRLIFAAAAILTVLFSGGCGALFLGSWIVNGMKSSDYVGWEIIAVLSLPPLAVGIFVWWLSMRRGNG